MINHNIIRRSAAVDPTIAARLITVGATVLTSGGGGGSGSQTWMTRDGVRIDASNCWDVREGAKVIQTSLDVVIGSDQIIFFDLRMGATLRKWKLS